ncbi:MAG: hypothetical protein ACWA47_06370 [Brevirhabdus sp.]
MITFKPTRARLWASAACLLAVASQANGAQVFATDLIVQGSTCTGFDCTSSESFGFDTLRLKENNLRIHFDDTSASASFPSNDWRIVANDSTNGGANYLAIEDATAGNQPFYVGAGAGANALVVEGGSGDIGIGTATPVVELHIVDGDSPTMRLEQNGSAGFQSQSWDMAGNETNFFVRDVTNGSKLPFKIKPSAPTNSLFVAADGDIGMGTQSPAAVLDVVRSADVDMALRLSRTGGANPVTWLFENDSGSGNFLLQVEGGNKPFKVSSSAVQNLMRLGITANNEVDINGTLVTNGSCSVGCDRVFADDYPLLSIDQQVEQMWANSYLPNIGPTPEQGRYDVTDKMLRMLSELEKAHIYIGQLHGQIGEMDSTMTQLQMRIDQLEDASKG